ncbi:PREDICTED: interferon-induced, double-stranded RNA-activated protein kinase isoform X1 [Miniopterus natalensis]|uniref:interferon-induced, double-stranded RNA-activated protein kinase isoform X1 n=1 Tax=Miniopterus natalensis TaxID=291302 RepID=UPI0007A6CB00|nr:PREDICTED: interferon-induced, double-stranded RNA-activated protein kinase isoform X1 [Miniopterus natalensis]
MADDLSLGFFIGELNKYCQKNNVDVNYHEVSKTGPPHDLRFTIKVIIDGREFPEAEGKPKKEAKNAAAKLALEILNKEKQDVSSSSLSTIDTSDFNYIGYLNSIAQKERVSINYEQREVCTSGPERFSCKIKIGEKEYGDAVGTTKQKAKHLAAKRTYEQIKLEKSSKKDDSGFLAFSPAGSSDYGSDSSIISVSESPSENGVSASGSGRNANSDSVTSSPSSVMGVRKRLEKVKINLAPTFYSPGKHTSDIRFLKDFPEITQIGSGAYGHIFKAKHRLDGKTYAVKRVKYDDNRKAEREVQVLATLNHPNIVRYYNSWEGNDYNPEDSNKRLTKCLFIQMEFCDEGTLEEWIDQRRNQKTNKYLSLEFFEQIAVGVNYIHSKKLIHRDLKPSNIFLVDGKQIKIGDFGLVTFQKHSEKRTEDQGTPLYMSPEQLQSSPEYGNEVDIFALGLILAELLYITCTRVETVKIFEDLRNGRFSDIFDDREKILLQKLLAKEPGKRPKTPEILKTLKEWKGIPEKKMRNTR